MGAKFSRLAAKSHARNLTFQAIGGGAFLSSWDFWFSFIALVIKLPCDTVRERRHMKIARPPTTTKKTTPHGPNPLRPIPELSGGGAAAFVGVSGSAVISVCSGNSAGLRQWRNVRWFHLVGNRGCGRRGCGHGQRDNGLRRHLWRSGDIGLNRNGACCINGTTAGGFTSLVAAGAAIGGGTATSLVLGRAGGGIGLRVGFGFLSQSRHHSGGKDDGANVNPSFHGREFSRPAAKSHGRN